MFWSLSFLSLCRRRKEINGFVLGQILIITISVSSFAVPFAAAEYLSPCVVLRMWLFGISLSSTLAHEIMQKLCDCFCGEIIMSFDMYQEPSRYRESYGFILVKKKEYPLAHKLHSPLLLPGLLASLHSRKKRGEYSRIMINKFYGRQKFYFQLLISYV